MQNKIKRNKKLNYCPRFKKNFNLMGLTFFIKLLFLPDKIFRCGVARLSSSISGPSKPNQTCWDRYFIPCCKLELNIYSVCYYSRYFASLRNLPSFILPSKWNSLIQDLKALTNRNSLKNHLNADYLNSYKNISCINIMCPDCRNG